MKIALFFFLMAFATSCGRPCIEGPSPPTQQSLANKVRNQAFEQLKMEKELYPCGIGAGMMYQIRMLALSFNYYKEVDIEQARELLMTAGNVFLNIINSNEQIHPFLQNDPFRPENIEIRIFIQKPKGIELPADRLTVVSLINGVLKYKITDSETEFLSIIYEENYEEAAVKLNITNESIAAI